ncbi:MAG: hypothetical protein ABI559_09520, partial [Chloroflexota bacterium]
CPKCVVFTDVGARCPTCAPRRKLPQLELNPIYFARGVGASLVSGAIVGALWGLIVPNPYGLIAAFIGAAIGYAVGESVSLATNRKAGTVLQAIAAVGAVLAYFTRNVVAGYGILPSGDTWGLVAAAVAVFISIGRVKF